MSLKFIVSVIVITSIQSTSNSNQIKQYFENAHRQGSWHKNLINSAKILYINMKINLLCFLFAFLYHISHAFIQSPTVLDYLSTRTPYRFKANKNDSRIKYPGCKEKKIWMMVRHGTRLPSSKDIVDMEFILPELKFDILLQHKLAKGKLNKDQLETLEAWSSDLDVEKEKMLTLEGQDEMVLLAERMLKRFPGTIKNRYDNETFLFRYTATERAQQSARFFANGLFERDAKDVIFAPATKVDLVLRFYKHCAKWQKQVKKNPNTYMEQSLFGVSPEMNSTLQHVSRILGFNTTLSLDKVSLMYKICGFETAWHKYYPSPWCLGFDKTSAQVMEYYYDLKHYWADGYGHDLTYRQACMSIKNMFDNLSSKKAPHATFFFSHSGTILKMISHLGLYKPSSHLRADNFQEYRDRAWRTTDIDCFATNLAFVLFECKDGDHVLTLHQEHPIIMPMCQSELCPLNVLMKHFHDSIHNCNYDDMCSLHPEL